jgi:hypothetical protein
MPRRERAPVIHAGVIVTAARAAFAGYPRRGRDGGRGG